MDMIRRLHRKFIWMATASVVAIIVLAVGLINGSLYVRVHHEISSITDIISQNGGTIPSDLAPQEKGLFEFGNWAEETPEFSYQARYFSILFDANKKEAKVINVNHIAAFNAKEAFNLAVRVLQTGKSEDFFLKDRAYYNYKITQTASGDTLVVFFDCTRDILALSSTAENVCVSPLDVAKNEQDQDLIANGLGEILGVDPSGILDDMKDTASQYKVIKKKVEQETADKVRVFISDNDIKGVFLEPTSKRYYPYSSLAAHVIGFVNANGGAYGLEAVYDEELTGEKGMVVSARDANGNALLYQYEQYFDAENGDSLVTTLDKTVQYYLEKGLEELESRYGTGVGATGIVMDVNTGGILAMASLPTYDLNAPASIYNKEMLAAGMTDEELAAAADTLQNMQWRNKAINDTFQPGSTFKILTLAMALEENKVKMSDTFNCPGYVVIEGAKINCSKRAPGHGHQDLITAFANSCNPAFINIGLRLGNTTFYNYMKAFGLTGKTGVDTTGEASGFVNKEIEYSTLALACYAFGQNFNVTPLSLINAQAACVNGGYLRTPYIVSEVLDQSGNVKYRHDTTPLRQVISENTSKTVREIMEYEVEHGTGKNGKVAGYRIGGKTGTADQIDGSVTVSFTCCAPADDPQIMMLLTLSNASDKTGTYRSGGNMAAPVASSIMAEILPYLGIEPTYSADELVGADHTVPNVVGLKRDEAATKLKEEGFSCRTVGDGETVTDQTPLGGAIVPNNAEIILYLGAEKSTELCIVPNVVGDSAAAANRKLTDAGLIMSVSGATGGSSASVRAISQSETPGTEVAAGTVVRVQFSDSSVTD